MRKITTWKPEEASVLYWLVLWGCSNNEVVELTKDILKDRSLHSIKDYVVLVRKYISIDKGLDVTIPPNKTSVKVIKEASFIQPIKQIADLKPLALNNVLFKAAGHNIGKKKNVLKTPNFEQQPEGYVKPLPEVDYEKDMNDEEDIYDAVRNKIKAEQKNGTFNYGLTDKTKESLKNTRSNGFAEAINSLILPKQQKELPLEEILAIAKNAGAKKVEWNGYTIKF